MTTAASVTLVFLIAAALFGSITTYGLITGKMLALGNFAEREKEPDWFWGWAIINGGTAVAATLGFLLMALTFFGRA
jgi:hypothetical protein